MECAQESQHRKQEHKRKGATKLEKIELTCIGCPLGCPITVTLEQKEVTAVTGNTCPRGDAYARKEVTNPTRIVTSTVRVAGGTSVMVSCKTKEDIPKGKIFDVIEALRGVSVPAPIQIGDILVHDVAGTGVDVVATREVAAKSA
jgi:CxxC motif-containing protein